MDEMTRTLWERINEFYIPVILSIINETDYDRQMMFNVARMSHCEMEGFIRGYLYLAPYSAEMCENHRLAVEISSEIKEEIWEIYLNRD